MMTPGFVLYINNDPDDYMKYNVHYSMNQSDIKIQLALERNFKRTAIFRPASMGIDQGPQKHIETSAFV